MHVTKRLENALEWLDEAYETGNSWVREHVDLNLLPHGTTTDDILRAYDREALSSPSFGKVIYRLDKNQASFAEVEELARANTFFARYVIAKINHDLGRRPKDAIPNDHGAAQEIGKGLLETLANPKGDFLDRSQDIRAFMTRYNSMSDNELRERIRLGVETLLRNPVEEAPSGFARRENRSVAARWLGRTGALDDPHTPFQKLMAALDAKPPHERSRVGRMRHQLLADMTPFEWKTLEAASKDGLCSPQGGIDDYESMVGIFHGQASLQVTEEGVAVAAETTTHTLVETIASNHRFCLETLPELHRRGYSLPHALLLLGPTIKLADIPKSLRWKIAPGQTHRPGPVVGDSLLAAFSSSSEEFFPETRFSEATEKVRVEALRRGVEERIVDSALASIDRPEILHYPKKIASAISEGRTNRILVLRGLLFDRTLIAASHRHLAGLASELERMDEEQKTLLRDTLYEQRHTGHITGYAVQNALGKHTKHLFPGRVQGPLRIRTLIGDLNHAARRTLEAATSLPELALTKPIARMGYHYDAWLEQSLDNIRRPPLTLVDHILLDLERAELRELTAGRPDPH